ncbi:hypothetical protein F8279_21320 [Micromonospora sp. AMSO1212t]|uniref:hypothetical protein n=1 Tax=Micromonospora sp. AMSO1212t TaxID=2650565 RepID=UPI00124AE640|nr:hypothetical protein [Micromonospora sp. AMSO1212t]KAB1904408.1 hypothetical protein F8279_21320 [Micromonospora sp. AMSO1212t]
MSISLDEAVELTRTGDLWVFRGRSVPDRAIQLTTNSPVNHVGMAVVLDDMPPLMWHAELGRSLPDMWTGTHQRGVQLHDLRDAVCVWANRYGQRGWLRQLEPSADTAMEEAVLRTVARLDGTPFPSTAQLAWRWARGRLPHPRRLSLGGLLGEIGNRGGTGDRGAIGNQDKTGDSGDTSRTGGASSENAAALETAYCAEVVAVTYEAMGLLPEGRRPNWYDPGRFWSGDDLALSGGARLGAEIEVRIRPR